MFETMVLATDLSSEWDDIVNCGKEFRALGCRKAVLTHLFMTGGLHEHEAAVRGEVPPKLSEQKKLLEAQGFEVVLETPVGLPGQVFNEVAQKHGASLMVAGSHGKSVWREALLGSVCNEILHNVRFPLLLLNVKRMRADEEGAICQLRTTELLRHVLYPTDFSPIAEQGIVALEDLIPKGLSRVTVLYTLQTREIDPTSVLKVDENIIGSLLETAAQQLRQSGAQAVETLHVKGHPTSAILEFIRRSDCSMIVMGTQGRGFLSEIFLGSVAYNVARMASCPVLLLPRRSV